MRLEASVSVVRAHYESIPLVQRRVVVDAADRSGSDSGHAIARAMQLDEAERSHLHDLARAANTNPRTRQRLADGSSTTK